MPKTGRSVDSDGNLMTHGGDMEAPTATPTTPPPAARRKSSKARRDLQTTIAQIDALFPALAEKPSKQADLLCEKASAIKTLLALETEERETEQDIRIKELEAGHEADSRRIAELTQQNAGLQRKASTPVTIPDPHHAAVKAERDWLRNTLIAVSATWTDEARAETAVKAFQLGGDREVIHSFCQTLKIDFLTLESFMGYSESALRGLQMAKDYKGTLVRAILAEKFPLPPKIEAVFIPDTRSADEKLRDAKASVRSGL
jgi:hypothetical protein